jgi:acyl-CoA synthetase (AMP-forming)/AMP-acid ligase II
MAGAPVPPALFADLQKILPNGTAHSPYGATESLPIASISAAEVLGETAALTATGAGTCVGRPVRDIQVKIIAITDTPLAALADARELPTGQIGEIIVSGPVVTRTYDQLSEATALAKIDNGASGIWHRLGDLGYLDTQGRLWFCGRKAERVETPDGPLYTEQVEPIFNAHPNVARSALIGTGHDGRRPAIVIEPVSRAVVATPSLRRKLVRELRVLGAAHPHTDRIRLTYLHPHFPVDVRHNAKIHRLALAAWAVGKHGYESDKREVPSSALKR